MHAYTHEYTRKSVKVDGGFIHVSRYLGSRCSTEGCPDNRHRQFLPLVKDHNDRTGERLFPRQSRTVTK